MNRLPFWVVLLTFSVPLAAQPNTAKGAPGFVINEVSASPSTAEFIELWAPGEPNAPLDGFVLVGYNGSGEVSYRSLDLDGFTADANGLFVVGNVPGAAVGFGRAIQNGPDAIALYLGNASDFPKGTPAAGAPGTLLDVVVYGRKGAVDQDLLDAFTYPALVSTKTQFNEAFRGPASGSSLQRMNDATRGYSQLFYAVAPTPGALNPGVVTVDKTPSVDPVEGYRLLSSPVIEAGLYGATPETPLRVDFYAENVNLVRGVKAGTPASTYQAQYPGRNPILFDEYNPDGSYTPAEFASDELAPGTGFYWYWFNQDAVFSAGGTSRSYDLTNPAFSLSVTGIPLDDRIATSVLGTPGMQIERVVGQDGLVMVGNPYAYPYNLNGVTSNLPGLQTTFFVYNPNGGTYESRFADGLPPSASNTVSIWQGFFAEVDGQVGNTVTLSGPSEFVAPSLGRVEGVFLTSGGDVPVASKVADEMRITLELSGQTRDGAELLDRAATIRLRPDAQIGWDRHDGSKLTPPGDAALLAFVGTRDGSAHRQGVLSMASAEGMTVPVAFLATQPGSYQISAPEAFEGRTMLRDRVTGSQVDLSAGPYVFDSEATEWTERFELAFSSAVTTEAGADSPLAIAGPFPNPAVGSAQFQLLASVSGVVTLEVYDAVGRRVLDMQETVTSGETRNVTVDTSSLSGGVYVVRVATHDGVQTRRMTIVR